MPAVVQRQVSMVLTVQKVAMIVQMLAEIPQLQILDKDVDMPVLVQQEVSDF